MMQTTISPDALRAQADQLEQAGQTLLDAGQRIRAAADVLLGLSPQNGQSLPKVNPKLGTSRLDQLKEWVRQHGPMRRTDVLTNCGLPKGTAGVLLKEKNGFKKNKDGNWYLPDAA